MTTLRIEHAISSLEQWREAFDRFADARAKAGVRAHRIHQPDNDEANVLVDLDFDDIASARRFLSFLETKVWAAPENSPALDGAPVTKILQLRDAA
jgi:hypothetical protein